MSMYQDKHRLYRMYIAELEAVSCKRLFNSESDIRATADHYIVAEHARWMNIFDKNGKLAGFLIMCKKPECHEHADYFIAQAYILPECRGQKLMTSRLNEYLSGHKGTYCLLVLDGNESARRFWDHYFIDIAGYRPVHLKNTSDEPENTTLLAYKPKKR